MARAPRSTNILASFATDAYKAGHFLQLPPGAEATRFYIAPRRPFRQDFTDYVVFGIRYFIEKYMQTPITMQDIEESKKIWDFFNLGGKPYAFPVEGFKKIVTEYDGYLPVSIVGVKEGQVLNQYNTPIFIVSVSDPDLVWLPGFIETALQRSIWYPSTVATISYVVKKTIKAAYDLSVDPENYGTLTTKLHDFGARGATSGESAGIGGLANLINFVGTDTMEAVYLGYKLYDTPIQELASSIPASEHSTVTSWGHGHEGEKKSLLQMIANAKEYEDKVFAFVSDSYDFYHTVDNIWGDPEIIQKIQEAGLNPVVRPDSGDPVTVVLYALNSLAKTWGYTTNSKGYKVLNTIRIIQGDGMSIDRIQHLVDAVLKHKFSVENLTFGMGGGLLQKLNRDSMSWSMKMYKIKIDGEWRDVQKTPATQQDKASFNPQNLVDNKDWVTHYEWDTHLKEPFVFEDTFQNIRNRAKV